MTPDSFLVPRPCRSDIVSTRNTPGLKPPKDLPTRVTHVTSRSLTPKGPDILEVDGTPFPTLLLNPRDTLLSQTPGGSTNPDVFDNS